MLLVVALVLPEATTGLLSFMAVREVREDFL